MRLLPALTLSALAVGLLHAPASAGLSPQSQSFGPLPQATFGGSGIPNNPVAYSTFSDDDTTITLGLAATRRYSSPALTLDGRGIYAAQPGLSQGDPVNAPEGAAWNFSFYVNIEGADDLDDFVFTLDYYLDATQDDFGRISTSSPTATTLQGSENLNFGYLYTDGTYGNITVTAPPTGSFAPLANGIYGFRLTAFQNGEVFGDSVSILVNVGDVAAVPEPSTFVAGIMGVGLLAGAQYRRNRKKASA